jgi:hypothetical protein
MEHLIQSHHHRASPGLSGYIQGKDSHPLPEPNRAPLPSVISDYIASGPINSDSIASDPVDSSRIDSVLPMSLLIGKTHRV